MYQKYKCNQRQVVANFKIQLDPKFNFLFKKFILNLTLRSFPAKNINATTSPFFFFDLHQDSDWFSTSRHQFVECRIHFFLASCRRFGRRNSSAQVSILPIVFIDNSSDKLDSFGYGNEMTS